LPRIASANAAVRKAARSLRCSSGSSVASDARWSPAIAWLSASRADDSGPAPSPARRVFLLRAGVVADEVVGQPAVGGVEPHRLAGRFGFGEQPQRLDRRALARGDRGQPALTPPSAGAIGLGPAKEPERGVEVVEPSDACPAPTSAVTDARSRASVRSASLSRSCAGLGSGWTTRWA
jgi:hypothetical protein